MELGGQMNNSLTNPDRNSSQDDILQPVIAGAEISRLD